MAYTVNGVDVSRWQDPSTDDHNFDGCAFVGIRACYGTAKDASYDAHQANARRHGAVVLAYCFGRNDDGSAQARALVAAAPDADVYVLDLESDGSSPRMTTAQARAFFATAHSLTLKKLLLYGSESGFQQGLGQDANWVAKWGSTPPSIPWAFWQWQGSPLDRDRFYGSQDQLLAFAGAAPAAPKPPASLGPRPVGATGWIVVAGKPFFRWIDADTKHPITGRRFSAWVATCGLLDHAIRASGYRVLSGGYKDWLVFAGPGVKYTEG